MQAAKQVELIVTRQGFAERRLQVQPGMITMGRAEDNDLVLPDVGVSRRHARIVVSDQGVIVEDLGSGNGTWYRGRPVQRQVLGHGDKVTIDPFTLELSLVSADPTVETTAGRDDTVQLDEPEPRARLVESGTSRLREASNPLPTEGVFTLGRSERNGIVLPEPGASRVHAAIECSSGRWLLRDQGSVNGTFVNGRRVGDHELAHGDRIRIGTLELVFEVEDAGGHPDRTEDFVDSLHDPGPPPTMPVPVPDASHPSMAGRAIAKSLSQQPAAPAPPPPPPLLPDPTTKGQIARAAPRPAPRPPVAAVELEFDPARAAPRKGLVYRRQSTGFLSRRINQVTLGIVGLVLVMLCGKVSLDTLRALMAPRAQEAPALSTGRPAPGLDPAAEAEVARMMSDGMRLFAEGKHFDAAAQFYKVMQLDAANVDAKRMGYVACESIALAEVRRVLGTKSASQQQKAEAKRLALASTAAALAGDTSAATARENVEAALSLSPGDAELMAAEDALAARAAQQSAYAVRARSEKQAKSLQQLLDAGQRELDRGQYAKAVGYWEQVLAGDPTRASTQYYQAEEGIRQAKDHMKAEGKKAYASALQSMKNGDWLGARSELRATLRADPYNEGAQAKLLAVRDKLREQAEDFYTEARTLEGINQPEKALALYQKVVTYVDDEGDALSKKAKARMDALLQ